VTIANFAFGPAAITARVGTTIIWTNTDGTRHTVTADDGSFTSGRLEMGASFSHKFTKAGTFPYHCAIHRSMLGTVIIH
jgi:plastocyanin